MATTRIKDISSTVTSLASDDYIAVDGATNGTRKMVRSSIYTDVAAAFTGAPTTYDICPLNSGTNKIDATYLPTSGDTPKGAYDANAGSPALADGVGTAGDYYDVTVAGTQNLGSGNITFTVGDVVKYNGSTWYKIDSVANFLDGYSTAATSRTALEVNSVDEDAEATALKLVGPALYFDGSNGFVAVADDAKLSFTDGTDDLPFSISAWVKMGEATNFPIVAKYDTNKEWRLICDGNDDLQLVLYDNSAGVSATRTSDTALTSYEQKWVHITVTYAGSGPNSDTAFTAAADAVVMYINGELVASTANTDASYAGMEDLAQAVWIGRQASSYAKGHIRNVQIFNRELTATEVAQLSKVNDLGFADEWGGALGGVYTSDFSAGADSHTATNGSVAGNIDAIGGVDDTLRFTVSAGSAVHYATKNASLSPLKRYRINGNYRIPSGQSNVDGFRVNTSSGSINIVDIPAATLDTWVKFSGEFVNDLSTGYNIYPTDGGAVTFDDTGGNDVIYVKDIKVTEIGTLADFRAENFDSDTGKLYDLSTNAFVGVNSGSVITGRSYPVYETGTWTPAITFGGGSTGLTIASSEGVYTRVGNIAYISGFITLSAKGSSTGSAVITGLPFTSKNTGSSYQSVAFSRVLNMAGLSSAVDGNINGNATTISLNDTGATGASSLDDTNFTDTTTIRFSATYQIS